MILTALNNYYDRLVEQGDSNIAPYGFSQEKISYALVLSKAGELVDVISLMDTSGKKPAPKPMLVPQPPKRAVNITPCFLWDKSGYVLGITASDAEKDKVRALKTHQEFKRYHLEQLAGTDDEGLKALVAFLGLWYPGCDMESTLPEGLLDANLVFLLEEERQFLHESYEAKSIRNRQLQILEAKPDVCLVTGKRAPVARLHPSIKGVNGAQSSGASLVSFNLDAFTSYGKEQGGNACVSKVSAFSYTTVLNYLLRRNESNRQRFQIGDATVVFWAEAANAKQAKAGENLLSTMLNPSATDQTEIAKLQSALAKLLKGRPLSELNPELDEETRIYVLGLAPNSSRLSIRFWEANNLDTFTRRLAQHYQDLNLDPLPWKTEPAVWRLMSELVPHREGSKPKLDDVPPQLAGDLTRAILTGQRYPQSLLTNVLMRMRADGDISSLRVALCKAVLCRNARLTNTQEKEIPVSLDQQNQDPGYLLGRLFASLESCQRNALGKDVNATIRDRFFGAASATPATIFPVLLRNAQNHLSKVKKDKPGLAVTLEKQIGEIVDLLSAEFPRSLGLQAQGRFAIGYYHQQQDAFKNRKTKSDQGEE